MKLTPGVEYKVCPSWYDPDENFSWDYEMAFGQDGFLRVGVKEGSTTLLHFDKTAGQLTDTPVTGLVVKEWGTEDPVIETPEAPAEKVTIDAVTITYVDGKAVEDGHMIDFINAEDPENDTVVYEVKDGKLTNLKLTPEVEYKVCPSWDDPDDDFSFNYEMAFGQDGFLRVGVKEDSTTLLHFDKTAGQLTDTPVTGLMVKEWGTDDPVIETPVEKVTIDAVTITYADGRPVEDGHMIDFINAEDPENDTVVYEVKDGKLTNLKLTPGVEYKVCPSWDDPDEYFSWDYEMAYGQDGFLRVGVKEDSTTLLHFDKTAGQLTDTAVKRLTIKAFGAEDPKKIPHNEKVNVADIDVVYEDGTPVEDGMVIDLINIDLGPWVNDVTHYTTKDGKITGIQMNSEVQYKIGFDTTNKYWKTHNIVGAYKSDKLMRIFARYEGMTPLYYDYDEGIDCEEQFITKLVVKKLDEEQSGDCIRPSSCWMSLLLSDDGWYAEADLPFKMTRLDTNKSKTVLSREGELTVTGEGYVDYMLTLEENPTYVIDFEKNPVFKQYEKLGGIPFSFQADSAGKTQAVLAGYDVEDIEGRLNYYYVDLKRIDGKENTTGKKFSDDNCCDGTEVGTLYATDKVTLQGMKVNEVDASNTKTPLSKEIKFVFYNSSTQTVEQTVTSKDGMLPDVELYKDHHYIVYAEDTQYEMTNYYITLSKTGANPVCYKNNSEETSFDLTKRDEELADISEATRLKVSLPVYYVDDNGDQKKVSDVKFKLVSQYDTVEGVSNKDGDLEVSLYEDYNYMVLVEDDNYSIESFPLTVKDKSEYGAEKYTFNHFSCGSVGGLYLVDKGTEHDRDVVMVGSSNETTVTGLNFGMGSYYINDRVLKDYEVKALAGKDYEVLDIDAINMYRTEISKLAAGDFTITRTVPAKKHVANVYYIDADGKLQKLNFTEKDGKVSFVMNSISIYNNVIEYKAATTSVKSKNVSLSKSSYTYTGKYIRPSVKVVVDGKKLKNGTDYTVSYSSNKYVGTAKVVVTCKGNYSGKITKTFKINPKSTSVTSLKSYKKAFKATWKKQSTQTSGYQIQYSRYKNFKSKAYIVTVNKNGTTSKKFTNMKKNQRYYVRVRTYKTVNGTRYYSSWSSTKSVKTK